MSARRLIDGREEGRRGMAWDYEQQRNTAAAGWKGKKEVQAERKWETKQRRQG